LPSFAKSLFLDGPCVEAQSKLAGLCDRCQLSYVAIMMTSTIQPWWGLLTSDQGSLERLKNTAPARWRVPTGIGLNQDRLVYSTDAFSVIVVATGMPAPFKLVKNPGLRVLADFVGLAEASGEEIKAYAQRWGVLGICPHGFPPTSCPRAEYREEWHGRFCPPDGYPWRCSEPLATWRVIALWARALLNAVAMLRRKRSISEEDWAVLTGAGQIRREHPSEISRLEQWKFVGLSLSTWLEIISFRPGLRIAQDERAEFVLSISRHDFSQLLAVVGLEMLFQVTRAKRLLTCSNCGVPYIPKRLPTRGEQTYCTACGIRAARRDAATRWRKRNPDYFRQRRARAQEKSP
jgi:hypothetical protein